MSGQAGSRHELAEFTAADIDEIVAGKGLPSHAKPADERSRREDSPNGPQDLGPNHRPATHRTWRFTMKALKTVAVALGITLAALIVIPLAVLAGLFVWLKVTEEDDDEILELDQEG